MRNRLHGSVLIVLVVVSVLFGMPAGAQNPLDTLNDHEVTSVKQPATVAGTPASAASPASRNAAVSSVFDTFLERINRLFEKLNSLASRVNQLMDRLAKAQKKKAVQQPAVVAKKPIPGSSSSSPSSSVSGVAAKVAGIAANFPSRYPTAQSFKYAPGTEGGNLGCANVVSAALREAGVPIGMILNVTGVKNALIGLKAPNTWKLVRPPPYQPGDVVCWSAPPGGIHGHIGIVAKNGNSLMAMNNSSSKRHPVFSPIEYRAIACVVRKV